jgi:hypothetical protein
MLQFPKCCLLFYSLGNIDKAQEQKLSSPKFGNENFDVRSYLASSGEYLLMYFLLSIKPVINFSLISVVLSYMYTHICMYVRTYKV